MIQGHRRLSGPIDTPDGYPLPLTGRALTKTPVVVKKDGVELKQYSETFIPGRIGSWLDYQAIFTTLSPA